MKLILENVRTFSGRHAVSVKPLTILTGENSSGKTAFLAMYSAAFDSSYPLQPNFNSQPYNLGNFDTIATQGPRKNDRAPHFLLGYERESIDSPGPISRDLRMEAKYVDDRGQVRLRQFDAYLQDYRLTLTLAPEDRSSIKCLIQKDNTSFEFDLKLPEIQTANLPVAFPPLIHLLIVGSPRNPKNESKKAREILHHVAGRLIEVGTEPETTLSIAPIRTKPERTYSQITEAFKPTGDHVPFLLDQLLRERSGDRQNLIDTLALFGKEANLFRNVEVKHFGKKVSAPFELIATIGKRPRNLMDVGYGVSQSLPILVQSALKPKEQTLLLQQPEVHLHPRGQAALGSFFSRLAATGTGRFLIETHSDYIIDRIRQEVAAGAIKDNRVVILYFHREAEKTTIHEIGIDKQGNLTNAPPYYREFFLREELNLLQRIPEKNQR